MIFAIIVAVMIFIDIYTYKGIYLIISEFKNKTVKKLLIILFWLVSGSMLTLVFAGYLFRTETKNLAMISRYYYLFGAFVVIYIPKIVFLVFHLVEDIIHAIRWSINKMVTRNSSNVITKGKPITRSKFLSQVGLGVAAVPFIAFFDGIVRGRFDFRVEKVRLVFPNLPKSFNGLKIVQVSDIHIGGFRGYEDKVKAAIDMVNAQNPDLIFFTGDLVNNFFDELDANWISILAGMKSKLGNYSILGNHDYGNYFNWHSEADKMANFQNIVNVHSNIGFHLLKNKSARLQRGNEAIAIIGVENWGKAPFPQHADYELASKDVKDVPFKILLSHDPTHWEVKIMNKEDVSLTMSGHTHGMQFGFKIGNYRWSPAKFRYPRWAGLYQEGKQYLYVNRGFGYIGFPGRVGMPPEITVFELRNS